MGRPTEVEGQRVETTVPVWLHNMVGSNWGWASGVSFHCKNRIVLSTKTFVM